MRPDQSRDGSLAKEVGHEVRRCLEATRRWIGS